MGKKPAIDIIKCIAWHKNRQRKGEPMEKRQAIEFLEYLRQDRNLEGTIYRDALNMAIEALKAQLLKEGTTKDTTSDLISRQQALDIFDDYNISVENGELEAYRRDRKRLCELPTIKPERNKGEWSDGYRWQRCSLCKQTGKKSWNYCPNCGARMKGERQK